MAKESLAESWKEWFHQNGTRLLLFARGKTSSEADAQDVLQDSILRLWRSYSSPEDGHFDPPPLALAYTAIRNTAIDHARRTNRRTQREQKSEFIVRDKDQIQNWFEASSLEQSEEAKIIKEALQQIPEKFQEVLTLKIWGELTFSEIAENLNIPANTAASRYRYALEALRKILKPNSI
ncbi:MAG: RNA polymerase sigma factor [Verrucomicrobiota bacterium]|nr:RNA polymerase sigma factor [Verrucomicrobiota bacterium]